MVAFKIKNEIFKLHNVHFISEISQKLHLIKFNIAIICMECDPFKI